ncbi:MAG: PAS domain S-box protein [Candidatus Thorarchaeota archaeon]
MKNIQENQNNWNLKSAYDYISEEIMILNPDFSIKDVNQTFCLNYGVNKEQVIGSKCYQVTHGLKKVCKPPQCKCPVEDVLKTGKFSESIHSHLINENEIYLEILAYPIKNEKGDIEQIVKIGRDITNRMKIEREIKESEKKLNLILSNTNDSIVGISKDMKIFYMNKTAEKMFGTFQIGKKCYKVLANNAKICEHCSFNILSNNYNEHKRFELVYFSPIEGEEKYLEYSCTPILNFKGQPAVIDIIRDVSERKKTELILKASEKRYREAYKRANLYKDIFVHDINNIFQFFLSFVELLPLYQESSSKIGKLEELIEIAKEEIQRAGKLVSNVIKLSEIEVEGNNFALIEIYTVLRQSIEYIISHFQGKEIYIRIEPLNGIFYIKADNLLIDLFDNILINAVRHNDNSIIEILIRITKEQKANKKYLKMEFIDNGRGIPDQLKETTFRRGYRKKSNSIKSLGIGLSLVKMIVESYNGKIWIENKIKDDYTKGSKFVVLFELLNPELCAIKKMVV